MPFVTEVAEMKLSTIVAQRGRNPDDPSDRTKGIQLEQTLEVNTENICNCLTSVAKDNYVLETNAIMMVRTEEGKRLRKDYESGRVTHGFSEHKEPRIRKDSCSNTLSTIQKDNYLCETRELCIKSANNQGYIPYKIGGGIRWSLFIVKDKERKSARKRKHMSNYLGTRSGTVSNGVLRVQSAWSSNDLCT